MVSNQLYIIGIMDLVSEKPLPSRKIGISGKGKSNVFERVRELNSSKSGTLLPVHCYPVRAWNIFDSQNTPICARPIESRLHALFKTMTDNYIRGEWFADDVTEDGESETERETERTLEMFRELGYIINEIDVTLPEVNSDSDTEVVKKIVEANKVKFTYSMLCDAINEYVVNNVEYTSKQLAEFCFNLFPELENKNGGLRQVAAEIGPNYRSKLSESYDFEYKKLSPKRAVFVFNNISGN